MRLGWFGVHDWSCRAMGKDMQSDRQRVTRKDRHAAFQGNNL